jgi:PmbA protein
LTASAAGTTLLRWPTKAKTDWRRCAQSVGRRALERGADVAEASRPRRLRAERQGSPRQARARGGGRASTASRSACSRAGASRSRARATSPRPASRAASRTRSSSSSSPEVDPHAGPADPSELCHPPFPDLELFDRERRRDRRREALARALAGERAALDFDPRIELSEGATFARADSVGALWLSTGFQGVATGSYASLSVVPVASDEGGKKRRGTTGRARGTSRRSRTAAAVGREAARRTLAKLGARKVRRPKRAIVFDPDVARSLVGSFAGCIMGGSIWRKSSYLLDREGTEVASPSSTSWTIRSCRARPARAPTTARGSPRGATSVIEGGVLKTFLLDCYSARKLGRRSTASASRGGGSVGPVHHELRARAGTTSPEAIVASTERGLYVTELLGFGFNPVTGDFRAARPASGSKTASKPSR